MIVTENIDNIFLYKTPSIIYYPLANLKNNQINNNIEVILNKVISYIDLDIYCTSTEEYFIDYVCSDTIDILCNRGDVPCTDWFISISYRFILENFRDRIKSAYSLGKSRC